MWKWNPRALSSWLLLAAALPAQDLAAVQPLLDEAAALLDKDGRGAARTGLAKAIDLLDQLDADRKLEAAMGLRWKCGELAQRCDEPALEQRSWRGVVDYYERADAGVRADAAQRAWFQTARGALARVHARKQEFAAAIQLRKDVVATWQPLPEARLEHAMALAELADALRGGKDLDAARQRLTESLDAADALDKECRDGGAMGVRYRCGQVAWNLDDRFGGALGQRAWQAVLRFYQGVDPAVLADPAQLAGCQGARNFLATIHEKEITAAGFDAAERLRREILAAWEKAGDKGEAALARARLGQLLVQRGLPTSEKGRLELQRAYDDIRRDRPDSDEMAQVARIHANALRDMGQDLSPRMLELQQQAQRIWSQHPPADPGDLVGLHWELANTMFKQGDLVTARKLANDSLAGATQLYPDTPLLTYWPRSFYAEVLRAMGDHAAAERLMQENLTICKAHCPPRDSTLMHAWLNVGYFAWLEGKLDQAMAAFTQCEKAIVPADATDLARSNVALLYDNWGQCHADKGETRKAIELLTRALTFCQGPVAQAQIRGGLAMARQREGKPDQLKLAADEFDKSVPLVASTQGHPQAMLYMGRQALTLAALRDAKRLASCLAAMLERAKKGAEECYTLPGRPSHQLALVVDGAAQLVLALADRTGPDQKKLEQQAAELLETVRSVDLRAVGLTRRLGDRPDLEALRSKAREARAELARLGSLGIGTSAEVLAAAAARDDQEFRALYAALKGAAPDGIVEPTVPAIAAALPADGAAVGFRTVTLRRPDTKQPGREAVETQLEAHIVTRGKDGKGRFDRVVLKDLGAIRKAAAAWVTLILSGTDRGTGRDPEANRGPDPAATLGKLVWDPLQAILGPAKVLVVCLDDELHKIPLELLPGFKERKLRYAVSLADLLLKPAGTLAPESLFAIGGIDFANAPGDAPAHPAGDEAAATGQRGARRLAVPWGSEAGVSLRSFAPLQGTVKEVESISGTFKGRFKKEATVLTGRAVTREAFLGAVTQARFLACATHGYYLPPIADRSSDRDTAVRGFAPMSLCGLALSGANLTARPHGGGHIGVVTAEEIAGLDLSGCELATVSACESYLGEARTGHGLASLQGALHASGVRAVVTTRWAIDDPATTELMTAFYRRLWEERMGPREALDAAKQEVRMKPQWQDTKFWAGFVLTGDLADRPK